ncbi:MAG TPA: hypothetical protein ENI94_07505 [Gammaproteobacteria bacterium]|nr:hypothetical protein [Gammaproteobacteria bacterium]
MTSKILLIIGIALTSPLAQAHDTGPSTGLLAHAWAHCVEMAGTGFIIAGILLVAALLIGLSGLLSSAHSARIRAKTTNHA